MAIKAFRLDVPPERIAALTDALRRLALVPATSGAVRVLAAGVEGTWPFLALEYQTGETFDAVMRRLAPAPLAAALPLLSGVAAAIDAAWRVGLAHGALHPRDIFVGRDGQVHVTGFGVVQALESAGISSPMRRPYSAPERAGRGWTTRADVFSLAVLAHELLTRRRPSPAGEQDGELSGQLEPHQRVQIRRVLARGLAEQPSNRFESAGAFVDALERAATMREATLPLFEDERALAQPVASALVSDSIVPAPSVTSDTFFPSEHVGDTVSGVAAESTHDAAGSDDVEADDPTWPEEPLNDRVEPTGRFEAGLEPEARRDIRQLEFDPPRIDAARRMVDPPILPAPEARGAGAAPRAPVRQWSLVAAGVIGVGLGLLGAYVLFDRYAREAQETSASAALTPGAAETEVAIDRPMAQPGTERPGAPTGGVSSDATSGGPVSAAPPTEAPLPRSAGLPRPDVQRTSATPGRLIIRSDPAGAVVTIDGRAYGGTPVVARDLSLGTHAVQVTRSGFVPYVSRVTLTASSPVRAVDVALDAGLGVNAPGLGAIDVDSRPRGARVLVDGRFVGLSPLRVSEQTPGPHGVTIELGGYQSSDARVVVESRKAAAVRLTLQAAQ